MRIGLIGLAGSGKTTIFNLLTGLHASTGMGGRGKVNLGVTRVPDPRVDFLASVFSPKKTTYAEIHFADMPGQMAAKQGAGLDAKTAGELRNMEVLAVVVRAFENPALDQAADPRRDFSAMEAELVLSDLAVIERRLERLKKEKGADRQKEALQTCLEHLESEQPLRTLDLRSDLADEIKGFQFLSQKRLLTLINTSEDAPHAEFPELEADVVRAGSSALTLCATLEAEIIELDPEERTEFLADLGVSETGRERFIQQAYDHLDLISFLTCGPDECRAWTIRRGDTAIEAAGKIHTDLARGFIRAEVTSFADFQEYGGEQEAKAAGKQRLEGKDYVVANGDILHVRFNV